MDLRDCIIIKTLAEEKSITRSASKLYISQPALTYKLKAMEAEFGSILVERTFKGVELTDAGKDVLQYANDVLARYDELYKNLGISRKIKLKGESVRIGIFGMYAYDEFNDIIVKFKEKNKYVSLFFRVGMSEEVLEWIDANVIDIAISVNFNIKLKHHTRFLVNGKAYVIYNKEFELRELDQISKLFSTARSYEATNLFEKWWKENFSTDYTVNMDVDDIGLLFNGVKSGLGWSNICNVSDKYKLDSLVYKDLYFKNGERVQYPINITFTDKAFEVPVLKDFINEFLLWYKQPTI